MKLLLKHFLIFNIIISTLDLSAQTIIRDSIVSTHYNAHRSIDIYIPDGDEKFPVIYLLDSKMHFDLLTEYVEFLSGDNMEVIPKMIVIGIHTKDRYQDLTPNAYQMGPYDKMGGGGPKLASFLVKELIPYIDNSYNTAPYKTYIGHALGGLHVLSTMLDYPEIFNNYVISDPSVFWSDNFILNRIKSEFNLEYYIDKQIYLAASNSTGKEENKLSDVILSDETESLFLRNILKLNQELEKHDSLKLNFNYFNKDSHSTLPGSSYYDALKQMFSWYYFPKNALNEFYQKSSSKTPKDLIDKINSHFNNVSTKLGYTIKPKKEYITFLASYFKMIGKPEFGEVLLDSF